jgi:hypothetical protein
MYHYLRFIKARGKGFEETLGLRLSSQAASALPLLLMPHIVGHIMLKATRVYCPAS